MFIEDLIRYVPDENPLKTYITTGKIVEVTKPAQVDDLENRKCLKNKSVIYMRMKCIEQNKL